MHGYGGSIAGNRICLDEHDGEDDYAASVELANHYGKYNVKASFMQLDRVTRWGVGFEWSEMRHGTVSKMGGRYKVGSNCVTAEYPADIGTKHNIVCDFRGKFRSVLPWVAR